MSSFTAGYSRIFFVVGSLSLLAGCDQVKELVGSFQQGQSPPVNPQPPELQPAVAAPPSAPVVPKGPTPEETLDAFRKMTPKEIDDNVLAKLADMPYGQDQVLELDCQTMSFTRDSLKTIPKLTGLRRLDLSRFPIQETDGAEMDQLKNLETLIVRSEVPGSEALRQFRSAPGIKEFVTDASKWSEASLIDFVESHPQLEKLVLYGSSNVTDAVLEGIGSLELLTELSLAGCPITDKGVAKLGRLPNLIKLLLQDTKVTGETLGAIAGGSKDLNYLNIGGCSLSDKGAANVKQFKNLEVLFFDRMTPNDKNMEFLSGLPKLRILNLYLNPKITDITFKRIATLKHLEELTINSCPELSEKGLVMLKNSPDLKIVYAESTRITKQGAAKFESDNPGVRVITNR